MHEIKMKPRPGEMKQVQEQAWVGDSVLELVMRQWVLEQKGCLDMAVKTQLTCNAFLSTLGHPTKVEAHIGRLYLSSGLDAARTWIMENVLPEYLKREAKLRKSQR
jgi:23S rRNA maturation mini-RNase III